MKTRPAALCAFIIGIILPLGAGADTTVQLTGDDTMKFNKTKFSVKSGEKVTLVLKHIGVIPKEAMGHNVVILKAGVNLEQFAQKAVTSPKTDYIPRAAAGQILAKTKLLGGGQSDAVSFTAPAPGSYPFLCTFPGHFVLMKGVMTVK